jgi:hypothetical protein
VRVFPTAYPPTPLCEPTLTFTLPSCFLSMQREAVILSGGGSQWSVSFRMVFCVIWGRRKPVRSKGQCPGGASNKFRTFLSTFNDAYILQTGRSRGSNPDKAIIFFPVDLILPAALGLGIYSASERSRVPEIFLEV